MAESIPQELIMEQYKWQFKMCVSSARTEGEKHAIYKAKTMLFKKKVNFKK